MKGTSDRTSLGVTLIPPFRLLGYKNEKETVTYFSGADR